MSAVAWHPFQLSRLSRLSLGGSLLVATDAKCDGPGGRADAVSKAPTCTPGPAPSVAVGSKQPFFKIHKLCTAS